MQTAIVIPCRNEERSVAATARSLGFGTPGVAPPADTTLILVDNASIDSTLPILEGIRQASAPGSVQVAQ
jgi:glycosyltransferase involved in cell wall biosynthesis